MPHARSAELYDLIYGFRSYNHTCEYLEALFEERGVAVATLLDVACGTAGHLEIFSRRFDCQGIDLSPEMLEVARRRCPTLPLQLGDMVDFNLRRTFDVVTCLFSAVAYVRTFNRLQRAVQSMAQHVRPGGLLVIEPWIDVERYWVGRLTLNVAEDATLESGVDVPECHRWFGVGPGHPLPHRHTGGRRVLRRTPGDGTFQSRRVRGGVPPVWPSGGL